MRTFALKRRITAPGRLQVDFAVAQPYCPRDRGTGADARQLGFALIEAAFVN
ncbi:hypothetical protein [Tahibacter amnicola]|uniref:Uncharacterized protein n=1 Tax=Tahibacter amnicola TaxID=2976241 RepID=A0ABY6BKU1_9GAMM|nr:hypothetical protein [Tahibacter amnicola]UXI70231.1 hypothetical protein N4264_11530 [Tahibacter amnicola]